MSKFSYEIECLKTERDEIEVENRKLENEIESNNSRLNKIQSELSEYEK